MFSFKSLSEVLCKPEDVRKMYFKANKPLGVIRRLKKSLSVATRRQLRCTRIKMKRCNDDITEVLESYARVRVAVNEARRNYHRQRTSINRECYADKLQQLLRLRAEHRYLERERSSYCSQIEIYQRHIAACQLDVDDVLYYKKLP